MTAPLSLKPTPEFGYERLDEPKKPNIEPLFKRRLAITPYHAAIIQEMLGKIKKSDERQEQQKSQESKE